ncbi:hypothetical protein Daus18300_008754 [Diaporthe australafricana]|uniref:F-box domain-containing protein n=1 Tax=Diaporthe australafricana TaxID=127596 RepID=A0ABR3WH96_9PEZI
MAARFLETFDFADSDTREQIVFGIVGRLTSDELGYLQTALQRLERRFDILCGVSKGSGAQLPYEIQLQIIQQLNVTEVYYFTNVCRRWRELVLQSEQLIDDLLEKWFPAVIYGETMLPSHKSALLHQATRKRHLRDSARFRSRFTCGLVKKTDGLFPTDRVEGLQRGRTFKDLTCSASLHGWTPDSPPAESPNLVNRSRAMLSKRPRETPGGAVSQTLYAHGRLAWQMKPVPGEWEYSINLHDFRTQARWQFSLRAMRTRGIKLALRALGRDLVVAEVIGERVLYAWDLRSHAVDHVTLQNGLYDCFTEYRSVLIATERGGLLLWSFGHGLTDIDPTLPPDGSVYRRPAEPEHTPRTHLSLSEMSYSKVMYHPKDEDVVFMATFDGPEHGKDALLSVFEFRNNRCSRMFTSRISPQFASHRPGIRANAQKADAHGTYSLLVENIETGNGVQVSCITFNTISKTFGSLRFQAPLSAESRDWLIWNEHMVSSHRNIMVPVLRPCILSVAEKQFPDHPSLERVPHAVKYVMESMMSANSAENPKHSFITRSPPAMIEESEKGKLRYDIARSPDIHQRYSLMPELSTAAGLRSIMSFYGGICAQRVFADDDDFLVVLTNRDFYTVFAVDEDGKIGEAMRDGVSESAENVAKGPTPPDTGIPAS